MSRPQRPWFRFYVETIDDDKIVRHGLAVLGLWALLMALARKSPLSGYLMISESTPHTYTTIAVKARSPIRVVQGWMDEFERDGLLAKDNDLNAWFLPKWKERQYESDNTTERTRKHRSREQVRNVPTSFPGTPPESRVQSTEAAASKTYTHDPPEPVPAAAALIDEALTVLADRRLAENPQVKAHAPYRKAVVAGLRRDHAGRLANLPAAPWTAELLADWLEPAPGSRLKPSPFDNTTAAQRALIERNDLPACDVCGSTGWRENGNGMVRCGTCPR